MEEKLSIAELLGKIHIKVYDDVNCEFRMFEDVIADLAASWKTLNDEYKNKLYAAMGIMPNQSVTIEYPFGVKEQLRLPYSKDTGIEYLKNQPICKGEI